MRIRLNSRAHGRLNQRTYRDGNLCQGDLATFRPAFNGISNVAIPCAFDAGGTVRWVCLISPETMTTQLRIGPIVAGYLVD